MMRTQKSIEKLTGGHNLQKTEMQAKALHPSQQPVDMYWHQLGAKQPGQIPVNGATKYTMFLKMCYIISCSVFNLLKACSANYLCSDT